MLIVDQSNKLRDSEDVQFVDSVLKLRREGKHWEAIDLIITHWANKNPQKYKSFLIEVKDKRDTRLNKHGSNRSKNLRSLLDVPEDVIFMIRKIYSVEELDMDKEFFERLYKRYPAMRAAESL